MVVGLVVALGTIGIAPGAASAHSGFQSYVYVSIFDDAMDGRVEYPISDLGPAVGIDFPEDASDRLDLAIERADEIIEYTDLHLDIGDGDATWPLRFEAEFTMLETVNGDYLQVPFEIELPQDEAPRTFVVTYSGIIESNPERDALFLIENDWGSATFDNEGEHLLGFSVGAETQLIDVEEVPTLDSMWEVARRGSVAVDRSLVILTTLIAVIAGATLGDRRRADRSPTVRPALVRVGWRVGLFAASATVTLALLGLTSAVSNGRRALAVGAVGVIVAAVSVRAERAAVARAAVVVAGSASGVVLAQSFVIQQLDRSRPVLAVVSFAAGALATIVFVTAMLLPLALLLRRWDRAGIVADVIAAGTLIAGVVWLSERLLGVKYPLRTAELRIADAVTSPIVIGAVTLIAGAVAFRSIVASPPASAAPTTVDDHDEERIEV